MNEIQPYIFVLYGMLWILAIDIVDSSIIVIREGIPVQLAHDGLRVPINL